MNIEKRVTQLEAILSDSTATISERLQAETLLQSLNSQLSAQRAEDPLAEKPVPALVSQTTTSDIGEVEIAQDTPVENMPATATERAAWRSGRRSLP